MPVTRPMFTGLVEQVATITAVRDANGARRIEVRAAFDPVPELGASICCSGICLTAIDPTATGFAADLSPETVNVTSAQGWGEGTALNIERSLTLSKPLGGHLVSGHVDGVGAVERIDRVGEPGREDWVVWFAAPEDLARFIAQKGSICIEGVSLTVNAVDGARFSVNLIPHTQAVTTLGALAPGARVNLEVDLMARYAARLAEFPPQSKE